MVMKARQKILHLTHTDIRVDNRILKELRALDEVSLYDLHAIGIADIDVPKLDYAIHFAQVRSLSIFFRSMRWLPTYFRHALSYLEVLVRVLALGLSIRPRLIHCHDTPLLPIAVVMAWFCRARLIYDAHELESEQHGQTMMLAACTRATEKIFWGGIDGFVTVSPSILRWYRDRFSVRDFALVYNSPLFGQTSRKDMLDYKGRYFHRKYDIPEDKYVFVYFGLLDKGRAVETLLQVFSTQSMEAHIVFVGRGTLLDLIVKYSHVNDRVHVHAMVPHEQVVPLAKSADFGLCILDKSSLSHFYALPNKLFEYAFAGVPVLASDFPDIKCLVDDFGLGFCVENDAMSIAQAVSRIEKSERRRITSDITALSWQEQSKRLQALYARQLPSTLPKF